jgi:hypothetical protein
VSRFSKAIRPIRKVFHETPILREVSQGFAQTFGLGNTYTAFDAEIAKQPTDNTIGNYAADVLLAGVDSSTRQASTETALGDEGGDDEDEEAGPG